MIAIYSMSNLIESMRIQNILLFFFISSNSLFAQFYSYDLSPNHASSAGIASIGTGLSNSGANLYNNPSLLTFTDKQVVDFTLAVPSQGIGSYSAMKPTSAGFYIPMIDTNSGWGISFKETFSRNYPYSEKMSQYAVHGFWVYSPVETFSFSLGIGPSTVLRNDIQSSVSLSPTVSATYKPSEKHTLAILLESPGKFRQDKFRNSDKLRERLPEYIVIGYSFSMQNWILYSELRKIFTERIQYDLNDLNEKPSLLRGAGAEVKGSLGLKYQFSGIPLDISTGLEFGGVYERKGQIQRGTGTGFGISYQPISNPTGNSLKLTFSILDYSLLTPKTGRIPETNFYFSCSLLLP